MGLGEAAGSGEADPVDFVNVAATWMGTRTLGPGLRSVVWVQGCPFRCSGCMSPQWIPERAGRRVAAGELAAELLADPAVTGLTFSGGEPMMQAAALAAVARAARRVRDVSVLSFTGFTLAELRRSPPSPAVGELLAELDVLIDGRYEEARNDGRGLRGSSNQQIHHLTARHAEDAWDLAHGPRSAEVGLDDRAALLVGVPPPGVIAAFDRAVDRVRRAARTRAGTARPGAAAVGRVGGIGEGGG